VRELSIFIDESGDFGPFVKHSPFYVLSLVFHDQNDDISGHLDMIHEALVVRGLPANHAIHTGPLIRREQDYGLLDRSSRRSIFRVLVDFVRTCDITHGHSANASSAASFGRTTSSSCHGNASLSTTATGRKRSPTSLTASLTPTSALS